MVMTLRNLLEATTLKCFRSNSTFREKAKKKIAFFFESWCYQSVGYLPNDQVWFEPTLASKAIENKKQRLMAC